jgi:hypothetical protein
MVRLDKNRTIKVRCTGRVAKNCVKTPSGGLLVDGLSYYDWHGSCFEGRATIFLFLYL